MIVELMRRYTYEAAHWLPMVPEDHKCHRMHGHSYTVEVIIAGPVQDDGMLLDYADIDNAVNPFVRQLDHHTINDVIPNSTAELQCKWFWDNLVDVLPLSAVTIHETARASCTYRGDETPCP